MSGITPGELQLGALRALAQRRMPLWLQAVLAAGSIALVIAALRTGQGAYGMGAFIAAMLAVVARQTARHLDAALRAEASGRREEVQVGIEAGRLAGKDTCHVLVPCAEGLWRVEFLPQHWTPVSGTVPATVYWLPGTAWPVLVTTDAGVMVPRTRPVLHPR
ncbi:hypothetical protein M4R22_08240 [Acidovorax sp. GBBC 3334]|uniref:hypothetical protein n=1 Tax=unclassified Acidovorax TaxID=2684926 RepID=UPI0023045BE8|nr:MULTISPECIES: hypothetical protein [unclassified Acidovorax]MDA8454750.1 hypothetical protein [Acidovorax sp. GBBC 3334]MDA8521774.1 hypothetical protein [Acidovorax sp. NCPPB 4044]